MLYKPIRDLFMITNPPFGMILIYKAFLMGVKKQEIFVDIVYGRHSTVWLTIIVHCSQEASSSRDFKGSIK